MINDGNSLYRYDQANRLISTTLGATTLLFNYDGDGARLRQVIAGVPTTYTQDLAAALPVVLQSKTGANAMKYVYALGTQPLAQYGTAWEYLLADALGSVRQIVDGSGNVTLAESYEPYGSVLTSNGTASSIFGYSGEQIDTYIKLLFLRARYYSPDTARFLSKDVWQGDYTRPQSLNAWIYTENNSINATDPSGLITKDEASDADRVRTVLHSLWGIEIERDYGEACYMLGCKWFEGNWKSVGELRQVVFAASRISHVFGGYDKFKHAMQFPIVIHRTPTNRLISAYTIDSFWAFFAGFDIELPDSTFMNPENAQYAVIHELGHVWDFREGHRLSFGMGLALGTEVCLTWYGDWVGEVCDCHFDPSSEKEPPPGPIVNPYAHTSAEEDWAEAFMTYIYPSYYAPNIVHNGLGPLRRQYVEEQIKSIR